MPQMEDFSPLRGPRDAAMGLDTLIDPVQIQHNILDEQVELWWFREPSKSLLCYCIAVFLIMGCGLGGIGLLSTTTSLSSEWRLGVGTALCLLAFGVLLKQLFSSAVQDMNCVQSREWIEILRSGGLSDILVVLITGLSLLICGAVLLRLALHNHMPKPGHALNDMYISGVVLLAGGGTVVFGVGAFTAMLVVMERTGHGGRFMNRMISIFTVSGHMDQQAQRATTSSMANLI